MDPNEQQQLQALHRLIDLFRGLRLEHRHDLTGDEYHSARQSTEHPVGQDHRFTRQGYE